MSTISTDSVGKFSKRFLWGASTSAHQVEGGLHNQWSVWELENAKSLATRAPYQFKDLQSWPNIARDAKNPNNYVSGRAADHFNRFEEDFDRIVILFDTHYLSVPFTPPIMAIPIIPVEPISGLRWVPQKAVFVCFFFVVKNIVFGAFLYSLWRGNDIFKRKDSVGKISLVEVDYLFFCPFNC